MRGPRVLPVLSKEPQDGGELSELGDAVAQGDNGNVQGSSRSSSPEGGAAYYDGGESPARPRTLEPLGLPKAETAGAEDRKEGERKAQFAGRAPPEPKTASPPFTPFSSPGGKPRMLQKMGTSTMDHENSDGHDAKVLLALNFDQAKADEDLQSLGSYR